MALVLLLKKSSQRVLLQKKRRIELGISQRLQNLVRKDRWITHYWRFQKQKKTSTLRYLGS